MGKKNIKIIVTDTIGALSQKSRLDTDDIKKLIYLCRHWFCGEDFIKLHLDPSPKDVTATGQLNGFEKNILQLHYYLCRKIKKANDEGITKNHVDVIALRSLVRHFFYETVCERLNCKKHTKSVEVSNHFNVYIIPAAYKEAK